MEIIFATNNAHKVIEAAKALGDCVTLIMPKELGIEEEIPETGDTLEKNAIQKCSYLWEKLGKTCFADDTGLETTALLGAPGVYSARYAGEARDPEANMKKLLCELEKAEASGTPDRTARFRTVIALILEGKLYTFEGVLNGTIARTRSGSEGFGYDPVFIPDGYGRTLAELSLEEKNRISHRGIAIRKLQEFLSR